ncbi:hypothetical protein SDC9_210042 [bioreactor metagenome]|uniref:Uncharacterized protein n=1 Tax=bioreactor metagenome TaxID=1076179 RepID=A0A645JF20_9ZZZZ
MDMQILHTGKQELSGTVQRGGCRPLLSRQSANLKNFPVIHGYVHPGQHPAPVVLRIYGNITNKKIHLLFHDKTPP